MTLKLYEEQDFNEYAYNMTIHTTGIVNVLTFNLAHWLFAFSYWALSWRVELILNQKSPDTYNSRINAVNVFMSVIIVSLSIVQFVFPETTKASLILDQLCTACLLVSFLFLLLGF